MKTTIAQQIKAVQASRVRYPIAAYAKRRDAALNDAGSTLMAMNLLIGNPAKFKTDLREAIEKGREDTITDDVLQFLRTKGFPV